MPLYFLGVATSRELTDTKTTDSYWCVPADTNKGDIILLYFPRSAGASRQGVFAECMVAEQPSDTNKQNYLCSGYGLGVTFLRHVPIKITKRFNPTVTARDMKRDPILMNVGFVRKNFQGTTFKLTKSVYLRIVKLAAKKEKGETLDDPKASGTESLATWSARNAIR